MVRTIILIFSLLISLMPSPVLAVDTVDKTICKLAVGYQDVDEIKADLLIAAKREVINELFGEMIVASTAVENFVVTSDQIRASSIGFVRVEGNANFFNGKGFAEVCVTIHAYVTAEDKAKFNPVRLEKKFCDADDNLTTDQLIAYVKNEVIVQALIEFNPKLKGAEKASLLQLVQKVSYLENGFLPDTQTYCAQFEGYVVPVEITAFLATSTMQALSAENPGDTQSTDSTLTVDPPDTPSVLAVSSSSISGIHAELVALERIQDTFTVEILITNNGEQAQWVTPISSLNFLFDEKTQTRYHFTVLPIPISANVPVGKSVKFKAKAALIDGSNPSHLSIILQNGISFDNVGVTQPLPDVTLQTTQTPTPDSVATTTAENERIHNAVVATLTAIATVQPQSSTAPTSADAQTSCTAITDGAEMKETIDPASDTDCFAFTGSAQALIAIYVVNDTSAGVRVLIRNPDGSILEQGETQYVGFGQRTRKDVDIRDVVLPVNGSYTILISGFREAIGSYTLSFSHLNL